MDFVTIVGLEVHVELATESKIFCGCPTRFGAEPNTQVCPICLGLPGVLPVLNQRALEYAIRAALALNCEIAGYSKFDRKQYFYPDLPKAYQISQFDLPLASNGYVEIDTENGPKKIRIRRVHLEEDAGKLLHTGDAGLGASLVDFNRSGVPLIEMVTEPDLRSAEEAKAFLNKVKTILSYTGVSHLKMEEGNLRCDVNVNILPADEADKLGKSPWTEHKNLSSFRATIRCIEYEAERQRKVLEEGGKVVRETRQWNDEKGISVPLRSKEEAHDYRYFPEPDLPALEIDRAWVESLRKSLPELPDARRARLIKSGLPEYDAGVITSSRELADFFDQTTAAYHDPKTVSNWIMGELLKFMNAKGLDYDAIQIKPGQLADMLKLIDQGTISGKIAKTVFEEMCGTGKDPAVIVKEKGLVQITDEGEIAAIIDQVIASHPQPVTDFKGGKETAAGFLVGQVMKATRGRANPEAVNRLLREKLAKL